LVRAWALAALTALLLAGCTGGGGDDSNGARSGDAPVGEHRFDELKVGYDQGVDYVDPGLAYSVLGIRAIVPAHLGLVTYKHVSGPAGAELIPALAEELPEISEDGRVYTFTLREGRLYSNGTAVRASDFARTIERLFRLDSPAEGLFSSVVGAERYARTEKGGISGIVTDDSARTIRITLTKPRADFLHILATTFAALVPAGTPAEDQSEKRIPATGPYMVEAYEPGQTIVLVRNPRWQAIEGIPNGNPDKLTFTLSDDSDAAFDAVVEGELDYAVHAMSRERLATVRKEHADQLKVYMPANTYFFFLNTQARPFDKLEVRKAVNLAIDRKRVVELYGGLAKETENILPPTYPQYERLALYEHDLDEAKDLVADSGYRGTKVNVWTNSRDTLRRPAAYLVSVLNELGFKASLRVVDPSRYLASIASPTIKAQTGIVNWFHDYPHPLNWFGTLLNGAQLGPAQNTNYSRADVPAISEKIEELKGQPEMTEDVVQGWKEVDKLAMEQALWAPVVNREFTDFFAERIDLERCYVSHIVYEFLFTNACTDG
jgi:peptide/nickel transport system substrate-binding protein